MKPTVTSFIAEICSMERRIGELERENARYRRALERIAGADYRGNRPNYVVIAHAAIHEGDGYP